MAGAAAAAAVRNVFVYGSLMAPEVLAAIIHRVPPQATAVVANFHRYSIRNRLYPAVLPLAGGNVTGKVLFDLTHEELKLLDEFEDFEYTRHLVETTVQDKVTDDLNISIAVPVQAYLYVWADAEDKSLYGDWDYETWRTNNLQEFLTRHTNGDGRVIEP
ncbi:protein MpAIG2 [Marchantia polymorpha subsp. ruderalis]|uniref:Putative gamma-glutamylcyclotransferase n=2 Tax=Marchantia polymorpha TaxID=3197 RepID=A0AAF6AVA9_MARPO|nr:hypothetical protein MARPO_0002s0016 [Marchantia polymorpha]BBN00380.1 hypothetical protein Mp_1g28640 [Marchantia polymorpha subsp. ruderalis]|eukprot:PTQ49503.1 hypothetical protein MARPO_0002s0016 [Marchantia polymorpha]